MTDAKSENKNMSEDIPTYKINLAGTPNSCIIKIGKNKFRSLVDTGAEISLMHRWIYDSLKVKPKLQLNDTLFANMWNSKKHLLQIWVNLEASDKEVLLASGTVTN